MRSKTGLTSPSLLLLLLYCGGKSKYDYVLYGKDPPSIENVALHHTYYILVALCIAFSALDGWRDSLGEGSRRNNTAA